MVHLDVKVDRDHTIRQRDSDLLEVGVNDYRASHRDRAIYTAPTEAMSLLIKKIKRVGHSFRIFDKDRLRLLTHCGVT